MVVHDLALADPQGVFARVPVAEIDWRPFDLIDKRLTVRSAHAATATLLRRPALRPSADTRVLPDIDIVVGRLGLDRLDLAAPVIGRARSLRLTGDADIRSGRALVDLAATASTDTVRIRIDSEPDRDRFDLDAAVTAPAGGIIAGLLGLKAPLDVHVSGDGRWSDWRGRGVARLGSASLADLTLRARAGRFTVAGTAAPGPLLGGAAARLTAPAVALTANATLVGRVVTTDFSASSPALRLAGTGRLDFGDERIEALAVDARLLKSTAFNPRLDARDMRLGLRGSGTFTRPTIDYVLTAPAFSWGRTGFETFRASGRVDGGARPLVIPVVATAARLTNVGDTVAPLVANLRIAGPLTLSRGQLASDTLALRSARIAGTATLRLDTIGGGWGVDFDGRLPGYPVGAIGPADIAARVHAGPDASGAGTRVTGTVRATGTRLDSGFFRAVLGGLPTVTTAIDVAPDLSMRFTGLRLAAAGLTLAGDGTRAPDGTVRLRGSGVSRDYGPATVDLSGPLDRPVTDVTLAAPGLGIGLAQVTAHVAPAPEGWSVVARGGSFVGAATARGLVRVGTTATIDLDASVGGITARGTLAPSDAGPFTGRLALSGIGLSGSAQLAAAGTAQRADVALAATQARIATDPTMTVGKGDLSATIILAAEPSVSGRFSVSDVRAPGVTLASASGSIDAAAGRGTIKLGARGSAGTPFAGGVTATLAPDRIEITPTATMAGRTLALDHPARIDRTGEGWTLAPVTLITPDGRAAISGRFGDGLAVDVRLDALGLSLLDLIDPAYDFGGRASGTISASVPADGPPTGALALRVAGLTRAGIATTSLPVDVGINAVLQPAAASARAVIARGGAAIGRAQAQLTLAPRGSLGERLLAAPLFAQARFNGPAQALWLLGGVEALDVRGPVVAAIDVGGRLGDPLLTGTLTATGARLENTTLGTVVDNVRLDSRFAGSRLVLTGFSGTVGKTGKVSGSGAVDLSAERDFPVDVRLDLDDAQLLDRDDLRATASGQIRLQSSGGAGRISGALTIARARFRLGRGTAETPGLTVTERNVELLGRPAPRTARPTQWALDVTATARDNLTVTGMGLDSVWRGDLRIAGQATAPELGGRVRMVRGAYDFAGKRFTLTRGDLRFDGGNPPDPIIDIAAENTSSGFTAQLSLTGTALRPDIKFSSTPALPEDEVLSRVLFGASITTLSAPEAVQLAGALASLRGGKASVLNPIDAVRKGLRIDRLRILPADIATGRKTSIAAGQYIGRRLYVELSTDAQGYSASAIEISLTRSLSILSDVATLGGTSVNLRLKKDY